jgi:predicted RNase H-like HicB family nuclease
MTQRQHLIVIEGNDAAGYSAYAPDLPGCVATAETRADTDAIAFHLEGLREAGEPIPEPSGLTGTYVTVAASRITRHPSMMGSQWSARARGCRGSPRRRRAVDRALRGRRGSAFPRRTPSRLAITPTGGPRRASPN